MTDYLEDIKNFHATFIEPYIGKPVGADQTDIEALEASFSFELPLAYKQYLEWMGKDYQGIFVGLDWGIGSVHRNTENLPVLFAENDLDFPLPPYYLAFYGSQGCQLAWFVLPSESENPSIFIYGDGQVAPFIYGSFTEFLLSQLKSFSHPIRQLYKNDMRQNIPTLPALITGGSGLLGQHLIQYALPYTTITATQRTTPVTIAPSLFVDLTDARAVQRTFDEVEPELVIHTAYSMNSERDIVDATKNVVEACRATGADLIYLSTDALFDGMRAPYKESDAPSPITDYGRWKATAEAYVLDRLPLATVVRTSLITQFHPLDPRSAWVANSLRNQEPITLFVDELRCPILVNDLAKQIWEIAMIPTHERDGVWHLVGPEALSRYTLGLLIAHYEGLDAAGINQARTDSYKRPRDLRLVTTRADAILPTRARAMSQAMLDTRKAIQHPNSGWLD